jgi:hypothetical protein
LKLGNHATFGAKFGAMRDVPDGDTVLGIPAAPDKPGQAARRIKQPMERLKPQNEKRAKEKARGVEKGRPCSMHTKPDWLRRSVPVLNIKMPQMDDFELLRAIGALGPDLGGSVPVVR